MENRKLILADMLTFGMIAFVAALFAFSGLNGDAALFGKVIASISMVLVPLSLVVKRPPTPKR